VLDPPELLDPELPDDPRETALPPSPPLLLLLLPPPPLPELALPPAR
jgi:hypothetical protein